MPGAADTSRRDGCNSPGIAAISLDWHLSRKREKPAAFRLRIWKSAGAQIAVLLDLFESDATRADHLQTGGGHRVGRILAAS